MICRFVRLLIVLIFFCVSIDIAVLYTFYSKQNWYTPITEKAIPFVYGADDAQIIKVRTRDNLELEGWFFPPVDGKNHIIVFFHGNGQHIGSMYSGISQFRQHGYGLLMVEYRGYAGHQGIFSESGLYIDARAFMDWVRLEYPDQKIILSGESMGSAAAIKMATEYGSDAVVVMGSFSSAVDVIQGMYPYIPVGLILEDQWLISDIVGNIDSPIMVIHGALDGLVNVKYARRLYEAAREPRQFVLMERAGHNDFFSYDAEMHIAEFLNKYLPQGED